MLPLEDVAAVRRLLGLMQYLSKFMPHLSDVTKPLRELTQKEVVWTWGPAQKKGLETLKKAVTQTPVLRYYNAAEEVTVQCDASQYGLRSSTSTEGPTIGLALSDPENLYVQIEKELLAIVFVCEHFEYYLYRWEMVNVRRNRSPALCQSCSNPLLKAPSRLQRMLKNSA